MIENLAKNNLFSKIITKHPETRGGINEKTISIRISVFVLTYGEGGHRKLFPFTTDTRQSVQCICSVWSMFFYFLKAKF